MGLGGVVERAARTALVVASLATACGGRSVQTQEDADDEVGGTGVGGTTPADGTADGGTGTGVGGDPSTGGSSGAVAGALSVGGTSGTIGVGGTAGTVGVGGADPCPECPPANYRLVVSGDGSPYELAYNGFFPVQADFEQVLCPEQPVRGTLPACGGGGAYVSVCEDPMSGPPCLTINGTTARYSDRQTGGVWTGTLTSAVFPFEMVPGIASGTFTFELTNADGRFLVLTVDYTFCTMSAGASRICL